jgi:hypothetical protein
VSPLLSIQMKRLRFHTKGSGPTWHHHSGELDYAPAVDTPMKMLDNDKGRGQKLD